MSGTYDVQDVSFEQRGNGMVEVCCSFMTTSVARGCRVTLCMVDSEGAAKECTGATLSRSGSSATFVFEGLVGGTYMITTVEDVEEDGDINEISDLAIFSLQSFFVASSLPVPGERE